MGGENGVWRSCPASRLCGQHQGGHHDPLPRPSLAPGHLPEVPAPVVDEAEHRVHHPRHQPDGHCAVHAWSAVQCWISVSQECSALHT